MKIAILADSNRTTKDKPIVDEAEEAFGEENVTYAPITQVRFDLGKSQKDIALRINGTNLAEFDCVLPIPTTTHAELFYTALLMLESQIQTPLMPFDAKRYLLIMNEELLFNLLESNGLLVRKYATVASNASLDSVEESIMYPAVVRPPNKHVIVTNKQTLKDVISLYKIGTPIKIETPIRAERDVWIFVMGDEVVASYERAKSANPEEPEESEKSKKSEKSSKYVVIDSELKGLALKTRKLVGCEYCAIRFLMENGRWVVDKIALSPDFSNFQKITGVNIARYVVGGFAERAKREKPWWYAKIEEIFGIKK